MKSPGCLLAAFAAAALRAQVPLPAPQVQPASQPKPPARPAAGRSGARAAAAPSYKDLAYSPLPIPPPPRITRAQLPNGMKLLLAENHEIPVVTGAALVRCGSVFDPPGRLGLATLTGNLVRGGGSREKAPDQLDAELESLGAVIDSSIGETAGAVSFSTPSQSLAQVLALFRDVLTDPAFRSDRVDLAKAAALNAVARRNDDARLVLRREILRAIYGKDDPRRRTPEYGTLEPIQRGDIRRFYTRYFFPANTTLVISGDFDAAVLRSAVENMFAPWKAEQPAVPEIPKAAGSMPGGASLAVLPGLRRALISLGAPGGTYRDRDTAALDVAAALLAGGPRSRLALRRSAPASPVEEVRAEAAPGWLAPGTFLLSAVTAPGSAAEGAAVVIEEIQKLRAAEPSEEEFRIARDLVWLHACEGLDNQSRAAQFAATAEFYGYPADELQQYLKSLAAVTRADVVRVAKDRLDPAKLALTVVAPARGFADPRGGAVTPLDLAIPPRPAPPPRAETASAETARKLLARAQEASGGVEKLRAVKDVTTKTSYKLARGGTDDETDQWIAPSILRQDGNSSQYGRLIRFTAGDGGWISNGYGSGPLTKPLQQQIRGDVLRHPISLLLSDRVPGRILSALEEDTIEIAEGDVLARVVFDAATGLPSELNYEIVGDRGQVTMVRETLSDYRDVNGIKLPFRIAVLQNGSKYADGVISEIKLDQGLKPEVLQRRP